MLPKIRNSELFAQHVAKRQSIGLDRAVSKLTVIVFSFLIGLLLFCAFKIIPFYYYFFEVQNQMRQAIKLAASESDETIRKKIEAHIKANELPVKPENFKISRDGRTIQISLKYSEIFYITFRGRDYDLHEFKFHAFASGPY